MTVRVYRSTDSSAPVLTGQVGTLVTLLDAVLVNGYGAKAALGWTKAYSGTNQAAYRNNSSTGTGSYLRIDDAVAGNYHRAYVKGFAAMSALSTGTDAFPTATLTDSCWGKSNTQDATARPWVIVGDEFRFYMFIQTGENGTDWATAFFGDIVSYKPSDAYRAALTCRYASIGSATYNYDYLATMGNVAGSFTNVSNSLTMPRDQSGANNPRTCALHTDSFKCAAPGASSATFYAGQVGVPYPAATNNGILLAPIWLHHPTNVVRGHLPGLWAPCHARPLANNDTFSGSGALAGKTFEAFNVYSAGQLIVETSDTWS